MLGMLAQFIEHALDVLPNMLVVLAAAVSATIAVSFFHGHVVTIKTLYLVVIMVTGTLRACANRRATFRTWHLSEGLNSLLTTAWHIRYSPIGAAS